MGGLRPVVRWWYLVLAIGCALASWLVCWWTEATRAGHVFTRHAMDAITTVAVPGTLWVRLLRGGLGTLAIPALLAVTGIVVLVMLRQGRRRDAVVAVVLWCGANGTVQSIKHGLVPFVPRHESPVLSGHMGVVWCAAAAVVLAVGSSRRGVAVAWGAVAVAAVGVGVLLAGWHTPGQVATPVLIAAAWTLLVVPLAGAGAGGGPARATALVAGPDPVRRVGAPGGDGPAS